MPKLWNQNIKMDKFSIKRNNSAKNLYWASSNLARVPFFHNNEIWESIKIAELNSTRRVAKQQFLASPIENQLLLEMLGLLILLVLPFSNPFVVCSTSYTGDLSPSNDPNAYAFNALAMDLIVVLTVFLKPTLLWLVVLQLWYNLI